MLTDSHDGWFTVDRGPLVNTAHLLRDEWQELTPDERREYLILCWVSGREVTLGRDVWTAMFREVGFTVNGQPADLPTQPVVLYRGCGMGREKGMSWSRTLGNARGFASNGGQRDTANRLWTVVAPPSAILAEWTRRHEDEVVLDTRGLSVQPFNERRADPFRERREHLRPRGIDSLFGPSRPSGLL